MAVFWEVVGGATSGGVLVRTGKDISSEQASVFQNELGIFVRMKGARLATSAVVREIELDGERLRYELVKGTGPPRGWISVKLKGKDLVVRVPLEKLSAMQLKDSDLAAPAPLTKSSGYDQADASRKSHDNRAKSLLPIPRCPHLPDPKNSKRAKLYRDRSTHSVALHMFVFYGAADYFLTWYSFVNEMPDWIDVAVFERSGQGSLKDAPLPQSVEEHARQAIEAMTPALRTYPRGKAPFAVIGHSTGGPIMSEVVRIAREEFEVEPVCILPFDEAPPNHPHLSDYGYQLVKEDPKQWLQQWMPWGEIKDSDMYAHDNKIYNTYRRECPQHKPFSCDIHVFASLKQQVFNDLYQEARRTGTVDKLDARELSIRKARAKLYASSEADQLARLEARNTAPINCIWVNIRRVGLTFN